MKAVILAGGLGTRLSEETVDRPKPMIEIGGKPMLWHIMKLYSHYGINDFIICCGYKSYVIKEYFANYYLHTSDVTFTINENSMQALSERAEPWKVTLVDTGDNSMTGGRLLRVKDYLTNDNEAFCFTYGDGLSNVNIKKLIEFHKSQNKIATVTAVTPPGRFGVLEIDDKSSVKEFTEKPNDEIGWINGGYFVLEKSVFDYLENDQTIWEREPLQKLSLDGQLSAFKHNNFWQPCDTLRDKNNLEDLWISGKRPWCVWEN